MTDTAELKALIAQSLESKGILGKIKAQLRASVVTAINEYEGNSGIHQENIGAKKIQENVEAQIGLGLVCEFLDYYGFQYALSVLLPEAGLYPPASQVAQFLKLPLPSPATPRHQPLLVDLVSITSKSSSSSHSSSPSSHSSSSLAPSAVPSLSLSLTSAAHSPHSTYSPHSSSPHSPHPQSPRSEGLASPRSPRAQPTHWPSSKGAPSSTASTAPSLSSVSAPSPNSPTIKKLSIPSLAMPQSQPQKPAAQSLSPSMSPTLTLTNKNQNQPSATPSQKSTTPQTTPQPKSIPQPQPIPTKPEPTSKATSASKNKEAAYLSYPEGDDDDIDEDIDEDLDDLDGDLDFEDDDEDIEIDATPQKKDEKPIAPFSTGAKSLPLGSLSKPSGLLPLSKDNGIKKNFPTKDRFDIDDEDEDAGSLEEDMKRLEVIEKKLNLFTKQPTVSSQPKSTFKTELPDDLDSIGSEDYSHSFEDDDALTIDRSIESDRSSFLGDYDHEEYIDSK